MKKILGFALAFVFLVGCTAPSYSPRTDGIAIRAIDGDTIQMKNGDRVRLIGVDTPERGDCGYQEATEITSKIVVGHAVNLIAGAKQNKDRYGRLLRYVEVDEKDVGAELLQSGRAIARYDSRDGYGQHPRENFYIDLDNRFPNKNICYPLTPTR